MRCCLVACEGPRPLSGSLVRAGPSPLGGAGCVRVGGAPGRAGARRRWGGLRFGFPGGGVFRACGRGSCAAAAPLSAAAASVATNYNRPPVAAAAVAAPRYMPRSRRPGATQAALIAPQKWNGSTCGCHKICRKIWGLTYRPLKGYNKTRGQAAATAPLTYAPFGVVAANILFPGLPPRFRGTQSTRQSFCPKQNGCLFLQLLRLPIGGAGGTYIAGCGYRAPAGSLPVP